MHTAAHTERPTLRPALALVLAGVPSIAIKRCILSAILNPEPRFTHLRST
jgi:hypothetical protein